MATVPVRDDQVTLSDSATVRDSATLTSAEEFLALVCSDEQLLRAEFDAIIAAEWPDLPPAEPGRGDAAGRLPGTARRRRLVSDPRRADRLRRPGVGGWARQRSPPVGGNNRRQLILIVVPAAMSAGTTTTSEPRDLVQTRGQRPARLHKIPRA
jgi:hypothetical protein